MKFIKKMNLEINLTVKRHLIAILMLIGLFTVLSFFLNNIFPLINLKTWKFEIPLPIQPRNPVGYDFRWGLYWPVERILNGQNIYIDAFSNYPPFVNIFFMPLQLINENSAYILMVFILLITNIINLYISTRIITNLVFPKLAIDSFSLKIFFISVFFMVLSYTLFGYPFLFSIERGNYDAIALLFSLLTIYFILKQPESLWLHVILLSIATHLKIYPAALFLALFVIHGMKVIIPTFVTNLILLLSLGFNNALLFLNVMINYVEDPLIWVGNHSGAGFAENLFTFLPTLQEQFASLKPIFTIFPIVIWVVSCYLIIKNLSKDFRIVYLFMVSMPLMCVVPTVSHDYKLVILSSALLIFLALLTYKIIRLSKLWDYLQLITVLILFFFIGRSFAYNEGLIKFISNKYPLIIIFSLIMLVNILPISKLINLQHENIQQRTLDTI